MALDKNKLLINQVVESNLIYDKPFEILIEYDGDKDLEFSYYILENDSIIKKIPYSKNNRLVYLPTSYNPHKVTGFIKTSSGEIMWKNSDILDNEEDTLAIKNIDALLTNTTISVEINTVLNLSKEYYAFYLIKDSNIIEKIWYKKDNKHVFNIDDSIKSKYEIQVFVRIIKNTGKQVMVSKIVTPINIIVDS